MEWLELASCLTSGLVAHSREGGVEVAGVCRDLILPACQGSCPHHPGMLAQGVCVVASAEPSHLVSRNR